MIAALERRIRARLLAILKWLDRRDFRRRERQMLEAFPPGARVKFTGLCCCERDLAGKLGTVVSLTAYGADAPDYRVLPDEAAQSDSWIIVCPVGMELLP